MKISDAVLTMVLGFIGLFINAIVLKFAWAWFVVNKFGLPTLTILDSVGIMLIVTILLWNKPAMNFNAPNYQDLIVNYLLSVSLSAGVTLLMAFAIHLMMG